MDIKWKVPNDFYTSRLNSLEKFTSAQEKEALLVSDSEPDSAILAKLSDVIPINDLEAKAFLLKLREISIGEEIEFIVTCPECNTMNNPMFPIEKCFTNHKGKFKGRFLPQGLFETPEAIINNVDKLSLRDYKKLENALQEQNEKLLKLRHGFECRKCNNKIFISIDPRKTFSKSTLSSIYQDYVNISMLTNNSKLDIDSMYPFERELYKSMIEESLSKKE